MQEPPRAIARDALGLGLRRPFYPYLFEHWPEVDYFEVISENLLGDAAAPLERVDAVRGRYPVVLHGVGMNLLGHEPLDERYLDALCRVADHLDAPFVTDHLCWSGANGRRHHDLLPTPYVPELVELAAARARAIQRRLGRPFGIENLSSYVAFERSTMTEWDFYSAVVRESGCWFMLDINNVFVSGRNHGFEPDEYLAAIDFTRVLQVHIAGHSTEPDGSLVDTHDHPVSSAVWALYERAWARGGPFPTLLEWDERIPPMPVALAELRRARAHQPSEKAAPQWLAALQRTFGEVLRAPLDRASGTLQAAIERYDPTTVHEVRSSPHGSAATRLAVYNRQYWFRLLTVMNSAFPLTASLLGAWEFNALAERFLRERPITSWDLDRVPDGFETHLDDTLGDLPLDDALRDAARIDAAWRALFKAPVAVPFQPDAREAATLLEARLVRSPGVALITERSALIALRASLGSPRDERAVPMPPRHPEARRWLLRRETDGVRQLLLEPLEGELHSLLEGHAVRDALALLEARCDGETRASLPSNTQRWLARGASLGVWCEARREGADAPDDQRSTQV